MTDLVAAGKQWRICIHESAHCVIARLLEVPDCGEACIEDGKGHTKFSDNCGTRSIIATMAGAACERVLFGDYEPAGCRTDAARVGQRLTFGGGDSKELWDTTTDLVRQHLGAITFLAALLHRERALTGAAIDAIVDACRIEG
jgi:hypothetical protein